MSHLSLVALVVRDYDTAIRFFVDVLPTAGRSAGLSSAPLEARPASCSPRQTASISTPSPASSSPGASGCSFASTTSMALIGE
jgi:hypothetical protein